MTQLEVFLLTAFSIGFSSVIGTIGGLLIRRIPHRYNDAILGMAAGMMLAAAILGLIVPAISTPGTYATILTVAGVICGAILISILDRIVPHLHRLAGIDTEKHSDPHGAGKILLFITAIAIHKLPEGLAAGVSFGTQNMGDILTVAGGISLQNIPEAMVIVAPLLAIGVSMKRTLLISAGIGLVSMTGTCLGFLSVSVAESVMPFLLSFAGGTMLYVISDEMIPETHSHGFEKPATFALISGFLLILVFQKLFA